MLEETGGRHDAASRAIVSRLTSVSGVLLALFFALGCGQLLAAGCGAKRAFDARTSEFIEILQAGDYERMKSISHPALIENVPETKFKRHSLAIKQLGKLHKRTCPNFGIRDSSRREGTYKLRFAMGYVNLEIATEGGKLTRYNLSGEPMKKAMDTTYIVYPEPFQVVRFEFLTAQKQPNPEGSLYRYGTTVAYRFDVTGLKVKNNLRWVKVDVAVQDAQGQVLGSKAGVVNDHIHVSEGHIVAITASVRAKKLGSFTATWWVNDLNAGKTITHRQNFQVVQ